MSAQENRGRPVGARSRLRRDVAREIRRSLALTALALVPGAGLTQTRYRRFGWVLLSLFVLGSLGLAVLVLAKGALATALAVAVRPDLLLTIAALAVVGALVWMFSIVLTHRDTEPERADLPARVGLRFFTALMCLLVALPTVQVVRYASIQRDVVGTVFSGDKTPAGGQPTAAKPKQAAADPWEDVPRVNMLLLGSDAGTDRVGIRTDSMVVASIDTKSGNTVLVSIPRNLERVPFPAKNPLRKLYPNGYYCPQAPPGSECLINGVWELAGERRDLFKNDPNPGLTTIRDVIGEVTGLSIDYSTVIDLAGFQSLVDAMGGVWVDVKERLPVNGYRTSSGAIAGVEGWIEPGRQKLDGYHALWYARSRLTSDDYSRMRRQRCLIGTILDQVNPATMLAKYPQLAQVAKDNISTDVKVSELPAWVELVQRIQRGSISSLTFTADNINPADPNFPRIRRMVQDAVAATPKAGGTATATAPGPPPGTGTAPRTPTSSLPTGATATTSPTGALVDVRSAC